MTRGRLTQRVADTLGMDNTNVGEEQTLLQEWANEAVVDVLIRTHCRVELGTMALQVGIQDYRLDASVLAINEKTLGDQGISLVSQAEIDELRRTNVSSGTVLKMAIEGDLLRVWPTPDSAATINIVYVARPTAMASDANDPSVATYGGIPTEHHQALEYYMLLKGALYDGSTAPLSPREYAQLYETSLADVRTYTRKKQGRMLAPARVGYPDSRATTTRNDIYP